MQVRFLSGTLPYKQGVYKVAEKWKKSRAGIIEWFKDIIALMKENKKILVVVAVFVVAIVAAILITNNLANKNQTSGEAVLADATNEEAVQNYEIPNDEMEKDAYPEINELMKKYYTAAAAGDVDTVATLRTGIDDKEKITIQKKSEYINSYPSITCYTKKGPIEDSFLVYVYYEVVLEGFEERIPALNVWYVCKNESGSYYINEELQDERVTEYCKVISVQDDVVDLSNTINVKFNEIMASNEELALFMDELAATMKVSVGEELAKVEVPVEEEPVVEEVDTETEESTVITVKAITVVNVRSSDSEKADKVGKASEGQQFTLLEEKVNGWSKIDFEGQEAYIKTEFLEKVGQTVTESAPANNVTNEEAAVASPSSGTATVKETIKLRKSASTDSEQLGVCYTGERLEVIEKQSDGWSKVKYNGKTGYVKSEFLE